MAEVRIGGVVLEMVYSMVVINPNAPNADYDEFQQALRERRERAMEANEKAKKLLYFNLTEEQRLAAERSHCFWAIGGETGWRYRVPCLDHGREYLFVEGPSDYHSIGICVYVPGVPPHDSALGMKWQIEFMEREFWKHGMRGLPRDFNDAVAKRKEAARKRLMPVLYRRVLHEFIGW